MHGFNSITFIVFLAQIRKAGQRMWLCRGNIEMEWGECGGQHNKEQE